MYEVKPLNKYAVIKNVPDTGKIGSFFIPHNTTSSYRLAELVSVADCDEAKSLSPGMMVLYDVLGAVDHRVGSQTFTTVKILNIVMIVTEKVTVEAGV